MKAFIASSSRSVNEEDLRLARDVAKILIERGDTLICGGISTGMMREIYRAFDDAHRHTSCVTLEVYQEDLERVEEKLLLDTTFDRTKEIYKQMDYAIFLPGGTGCVAEFFSMLEEARTLKTKKLILYNKNGIFDSLISFIGTAIGEGRNDKSILRYFDIVTTLDELIQKLEGEDENE